jgi:xanthine dehydrogenase YagS FAD-binding subunit
MKNFDYTRPSTINEAISLLQEEGAELISGGIDVLSLIKNELKSPEKLVSLSQIDGLKGINADNSTITIGAMTPIKDIADSKLISNEAPALTRAASILASPQIRHMGTVAGNLCQRPRCWYFRDATVPCLRKGGEKCFAAPRGAKNQYHCILGGGPCFIVHPSDLATVFMMLDANLKMMGSDEEKNVPAEDFFLLPKEDPHRENVLQEDEIITHITFNVSKLSRNSYYESVKSRNWSYPLVAVAAGMDIDSQNVCRQLRVVLGSVAPIPWKVEQTEDLIGKKISDDLVEKTASDALSEARPLPEAAYKVDIAQNIFQRVLLKLANK